MPDEALEVLELTEKAWWNYRDGVRHWFNWRAILTQLIQKVSEDNRTRRTFCEKHSEGMVAESSWKFLSPHAKAMAHEWFRHSECQDRRRVVPEFAALGIIDLYNLCWKYGGFEEERLPNHEEERKIIILEKAAAKERGDLICYDWLPECRILLNERAPILGKARCFKEREKRQNRIGMRVASRINHDQSGAGSALQFNSFPAIIACSYFCFLPFFISSPTSYQLCADPRACHNFSSPFSSRC